MVLESTERGAESTDPLTRVFMAADRDDGGNGSGSFKTANNDLSLRLVLKAQCHGESLTSFSTTSPWRCVRCSGSGLGFLFSSPSLSRHMIARCPKLYEDSYM
jgi:hypothetical protein